jgi:hypothetical protein
MNSDCEIAFTPLHYLGPGKKRNLFEMTAHWDRWTADYLTFDRQRYESWCIDQCHHEYVGGIVMMDTGGSHG